MSFSRVCVCNVRSFLSRRISRNKRARNCMFSIHMEPNLKSTYEEAVAALNGLQSNYAVIQKAREKRDAEAYLNIANTTMYLNYLGVKLDELDSLNVIHVSGTKGKGSTCAFTESILRQHGYKTGFYSSPHLISVNERIRINGLPISKDKFTKYFWKTYNNIQQNLKNDETMPSYFMFLTVMAFYVFLKEKVDAAILEVGIGGLYDCTNIIQKPVAVGITTLGMDHVNLLGDTLSKIAVQKAGIMKSNAPAFTVPQQESAMTVLRQRAHEIGCSLLLSPPVEAYEESIALGVKGSVQKVNASLALQLSNAWLQNKSKISSSFCKISRNGQSLNLSYPLLMAPTFSFPKKTQDGLKSCVWLGRFQVIERDHLTFYLDGAHTHDSMKYCVKWFADTSLSESNKYKNSQVLKVLLFNCTGERKAESLLDPLADILFDLVLFCPNRVDVIKDAASDLSNFMVTPEKEMQQCVINKEIWGHFMRSIFENEFGLTSTLNGSSKIATDPEEHSLLFPSIGSALSFLSPSANSDVSQNARALNNLVKNAKHIQILVTGSLHLVGGVLSLISHS